MSDDPNPRERTYALRLSTDEYIMMHEKAEAHGLRRSEYMRGLLMGTLKPLYAIDEATAPARTILWSPTRAFMDKLCLSMAATIIGTGDTSMDLQKRIAAEAAVIHSDLGPPILPDTR